MTPLQVFASKFPPLLLVLALGFAIGLLQRDRFRWRWLLIATAIVVVHEVATARLFVVPRLPFYETRWNWSGKVLATLATVAIASLPAFGWRRSGLTLHQARDGRLVTWTAALAVVVLVLAIAVAFPTRHAPTEILLYQLTMPGLDEETFFRGVLLLALNEAFTGRARLLGIGWGWGALLSSLLFGLGHAVTLPGGELAFSVYPFLGTFLPALLLVWFRERTGSVVLPILLHNFGNAASYLV